MRKGKIVAGMLIVWSAASGAAFAQGNSACPNPNALGVARTVEIDTTEGPGFGFEHYKAYDFLRLKEVVLTFDDGPQVGYTHAVLEALAAHCTKATFFSIGKMAAGMPEIIRDVAKAGHTIGTHTWSHADLSKLKDEAEWKAEIEKGVSAVRRAVGGPIAPFFRYPVLKDTKDSLAHLAKRNIAIFSADLDSFDFKMRNAEGFVKSVMARLEKKGKGILLFHDVQPVTSKALPQVLTELKAKGYKVVHMRPKAEVKTLAEYDAQIEPLMKGMAAGNARPMSSVVRTVDEESPQPTATVKATGSIKK
jgi:peptidoglycan/xylan/chitin deacetylase (PgdA/CDA1 family)